MNVATSARYSGLFALAAHGDREDDGSVWNEISCSGIHLDPVNDGRTIVLSRAAIEQMVENHSLILAEGWHGAGRGVPFRFDPDHSMGGFFGGNAEALLPGGDVMELRAEEKSDGELLLLARVAWSGRGKELLGGGNWPTASIEFWAPGELRHRAGPSKGEPISGYVMTGVVATGHPMVIGLAPLVASTRLAPHAAPAALPSETSPMSKSTLAALLLAIPLFRDLGGLTDESSDGSIVAATSNLSERLKRAEADVGVVKESLATVTADREQLAAELAKHETEAEKRRVDAAIAEGRCTPAESDLYLRSIKALGVDDTHRAFTRGRVKLGASSVPIAEAGDGNGEAWVSQRCAALMSADPTLDRLGAWQRAMGEQLANAPRNPSDDYVGLNTEA